MDGPEATEAEENLKGQYYYSQEENKMLLNERKERQTDRDEGEWRKGEIQRHKESPEKLDYMMADNCKAKLIDLKTTLRKSPTEKNMKSVQK